MKRHILQIIKWFALASVLTFTGCMAQSSSQSHFVPVLHGKMEYYELGAGSPIVLIPGYGTDVSSWDQAFLTTLAQRHQLIVLNNRNVGRSIIKSSRYESQDLANDVHQLIVQLKLSKPAVLGISMGGMIAQQLAVSHPNDVGQLILINTVIAGHQAVAPSGAVKKLMLRKPKNQLDRYAVALELFFPPSSITSMAYVLAADRFQPPHYKPVSTLTILPQQTLVMHWIADNATGDKISQLKLPVLILNGNADIVIPPINSVILARNIRYAQLLRWENGGHGMIFQYPNQIANAVSDFIADGMIIA
jgi:pimeloyl-ACP methyl ester carboxylesterase